MTGPLPQAYIELATTRSPEQSSFWPSLRAACSTCEAWSCIPRKHETKSRELFLSRPRILLAGAPLPCPASLFEDYTFLLCGIAEGLARVGSRKILSTSCHHGSRTMYGETRCTCAKYRTLQNGSFAFHHTWPATVKVEGVPANEVSCKPLPWLSSLPPTRWTGACPAMRTKSVNPTANGYLAGIGPAESPARNA